MCRRLIFLISVAALAGLVLTSVAKADPNLVGWWKLDEGTGTTTVDSSDNSNDGSFGIDAFGNPDSNNAPQWADGRRGERALFFEFTDGVDFVSCGNDVSLDINGPFTMMAWIRGPFDDWTANSIASKGDSWELHMWSNYRVDWHVSVLDYDGNSPKIEEGFQPGIYTGWHHLAGTWDTNVLTLYYDGNFVSSDNTYPDKIPPFPSSIHGEIHLTDHNHQHPGTPPQRYDQ